MKTFDEAFELIVSSQLTADSDTATTRAEEFITRYGILYDLNGNPTAITYLNRIADRIFEDTVSHLAAGRPALAYMLFTHILATILTVGVAIGIEMTRDDE